MSFFTWLMMHSKKAFAGAAVDTLREDACEDRDYPRRAHRAEQREYLADHNEDAAEAHDHAWEIYCRHVPEPYRLTKDDYVPPEDDDDGDDDNIGTALLP